VGGGHAPNDIVIRTPLRKKVLVKSPASIANLGPGFDVIALAIEGPHDRVLAEALDEPRLIVNADNAPSGKENSAYAVAEHMLSKYCPSCGVRISVWKGVPISAGLGSSGATSAAAAFALNELFGLNLPIEELIEAAVEGEHLVAGARHYDNVVASLLGGLVIIGKYAGLGMLRLDPPEVWFGIVVMSSAKKGKTGFARSLIPKRLGLEQHVAQTSAIASLLASIHLKDPELFGKAVSVDYVAEPVRKAMIPLYDELKAMALKEGALGFNISGAGPSVFAVHTNRDEAERIASLMVDHLSSNGVEAKPLVARPSAKGVIILDSN